MENQTDNQWMRWLREPVVHFVLIGLAIFAADRAMQPDNAPDDIVVTEQTVERMRADYETRHGSPPDDAKTRALIDAHVRDEVLYREALELGLHRSDPIVRRRMIQAMEFLSEDLAPVPRPTEEQLRAYLEAHPDRFARPARATFRHVFFANATSSDARVYAGLGELRDGATTSDMGDAFPHGTTIEHASRQVIAGKFGAGFADAVMDLEPGRWSEPIASKYGAHLVYIESMKPAGPPSLDAARHQVEVAWRHDARERANAQATERLRAEYDVRIEWKGAQP